MNKNKNHQQVFRIPQSKKGEMSTQQIVVLIILIASFSILLFFLARLNLGQTTEREVCRNSVLIRGSSVLPTDSIPLNCQRSYLCLTSDGSCESLTKPRKKKVQTKDEVYEVLANELADCWWMFGAGEIDYVGTDLLKNNDCSICTQVAFDDSIKDIFETGEIDEEYFYNTYLENKNVPGKDETYTEYLYGSKDFSEVHEGNFKNLDLNNQYYVMMGIKSKVSTALWVTGGVVAGGIAALTFIPSGGASLIILGKIVGGVAVGVGAGIGGYYVAGVIQGGSGNEYIPPQ